MATIRIDGVNDRLPVGKILCLGRNYLAHVREMGAEVAERPVVFLKPPTALLEEGEPIRLPPLPGAIHYEVEMVLLVGTGGKDIPLSGARSHLGGYGVGLDLTARDLQSEAKQKGNPWAISKGFDGSAPVSRFVPASRVPDPHALDLVLRLNGVVRQQSNTSLMMTGVDETVSWLSTIFTLCPGDLIFTGTPEGVGPIQPGDRLDISLGSLVTASFRVAPE
jgi:2-keto-4-pentenoate hydratase/2-oxohepta-3-ene-1,7-dioic acid hydratase in catechol pathway